MKVIGRILLDGINSISGLKEKNDKGLVRMFEVEYSNEYRCAVRRGIEVDGRYVRDFMKSTR